MSIHEACVRCRWWNTDDKQRECASTATVAECYAQPQEQGHVKKSGSLGYCLVEDES